MWPPTYIKGVQNVFMIFITSNPSKDFLPRCICYVWVSMNIYSYIELKLTFVGFITNRWGVWLNEYYLFTLIINGPQNGGILKADCKIQETF